MKSLVLSYLLIGASSTTQAAIVFSETQNIAIPFDFDGVYLNVSTGQTTASEPTDWTTTPTVNFFFGGVGIATDDFFRPVADNDGRVLNLTVGSEVGDSLNFSGSPSGSETHTGSSPDQFQLAESGYLGFSFNITGAETSPYYGWIKFTPSTSGGAVIESWAIESTPGQSIQVGAIPEPASTTVLGSLGCALLFLRRRLSR
jgi:hypothetical protein